MLLSPFRPTPAFIALATALLFHSPLDAQTSLTANGSAKIVTGAGGRPLIVLTPAAESQAGSVFTTKAVLFGSKYVFATFFQFAMTHQSYQASDGMTFVLQAQGNTALGAGGGSLGYSGITPSVAVEFDTYQNSPFDLNDNHVAILTDGQMDDLDPQTPYGVTNCQPTSTGVFGCMSNGDVWSVWIEYDGTFLNVALADNSTIRPPNLISYPINIPGLLTHSPAFVGFTAGTGLGVEEHVVLNWIFK